MGYYKESNNVYEENYYVTNDNEDIVFYMDGHRQIIKSPIVIFNNENIKFNFQNYALRDYEYVISAEDTLADKNKKVQLEESKKLLKQEGLARKCEHQQIRIKIEFGDDQTVILNKPLTYKEIEAWDKIDHHYEFKDKKFFEDNGERDAIDLQIESIFGKRYVGKIVITLNNILNTRDVVIIPFNIEKSSSSINGKKMELISANLTNDNNVAFTFNIVNDKQIVFASKKKNS